MPVTEAGDIPEDARDITEDVVKMKSDLSDLFQGKDMSVIGTAVGAVIGETLPGAEAVKEFLYLICCSAGEHFALTNPDIQPPEGGRVH